MGINKKTVSYYIPVWGETPEDAELFDTYCNYPDLIAVEIAEHIHNNRDGWESTWPMIVVVIFGGKERKFSIERESRPEFIANEIEETDELPQSNPQRTA